MYIRGGQQMPETEEGAAFFKPMGEELNEQMQGRAPGPLDPWGCFPGSAGLGATDQCSETRQACYSSIPTEILNKGQGQVIKARCDSAYDTCMTLNVPPPSNGTTTGAGSNTKYWILGAIAVAGVWIWSKQ